MPGLLKGSRKPEIVADATYHIITQNDHFRTGQFFIDEKVLSENGIDDLSVYATEFN